VSQNDVMVCLEVNASVIVIGLDYTCPTLIGLQDLREACSAGGTQNFSEFPGMTNI